MIKSYKFVLGLALPTAFDHEKCLRFIACCSFHNLPTPKLMYVSSPILISSLLSFLIRVLRDKAHDNISLRDKIILSKSNFGENSYSILYVFKKISRKKILFFILITKICLLFLLYSVILLVISCGFFL